MVQMGSMFSNLTRSFYLLKKLMNINVARSAVLKLILVPASRYNCGVK